MGCLRLMETGQEPAHGAHTATRSNDQARPSFAGMNLAMQVRHALQRAHDRCADCDDAAAASARLIYATRRLGWDTVELLVRRFMRIDIRDTRVQDQRQHPNTFG